MSGQFDGDVEAIFHEGACSDTMETDGRYMMENNYRYSLGLPDWCVGRKCSSSTPPALPPTVPAVFKEERQHEGPLNVYGYSKFLFDQIVRKRLPDASSQVVGFRYFNILARVRITSGPHGLSVAYHHFHQCRNDGRSSSSKARTAMAGGQQRDFVFVGDVAKGKPLVPRPSGKIRHLQPRYRGARAELQRCRRRLRQRCACAQGRDAALARCDGVAGPCRIRGLPEALKGSIRPSRRPISRSCAAGYTDEFATVEEGVRQYVEWLARMHKTLENFVGNTPLVRLQRLRSAISARGNVILAKLEGNNPVGP